MEELNEMSCYFCGKSSKSVETEILWFKAENSAFPLEKDCICKNCFHDRKIELKPDIYTGSQVIHQLETVLRKKLRSQIDPATRVDILMEMEEIFKPVRNRDEIK